MLPNNTTHVIYPCTHVSANLDHEPPRPRTGRRRRRDDTARTDPARRLLPGLPRGAGSGRRRRAEPTGVIRRGVIAWSARGAPLPHGAGGRGAAFRFAALWSVMVGE